MQLETQPISNTMKIMWHTFGPEDSEMLPLNKK